MSVLLNVLSICRIALRHPFSSFLLPVRATLKDTKLDSAVVLSYVSDFSVISSTSSLLEAALIRTLMISALIISTTSALCTTPTTSNILPGRRCGAQSNDYRVS